MKYLICAKLNEQQIQWAEVKAINKKQALRKYADFAGLIKDYHRWLMAISNVTWRGEL